MTVDEPRRRALFTSVAGTLGEEQAVTMFELLPPSGSDVATQQRMDQRFEAVDLRFEAIDRRFEAVDQRFDDLQRQMDHRFDDQRRYLDARLDSLRDEVLAAFRGELVTAVSGQTRAVIVATATATFGIGGLAVTLAQVL